MHATITCSCGLTSEVEAPDLEALGVAISAATLAIHVTSPHEVHGVSVDIDSRASTEHELVLQCLRDGCERTREMRVMVPYSLVGALTLVFHTSHEGHRLLMSYDGKTWESPGERKP